MVDGGIETLLIGSKSSELEEEERENTFLKGLRHGLKRSPTESCTRKSVE